MASSGKGTSQSRIVMIHHQTDASEEKSSVPVLAFGGGLTLLGVLRVFGRAGVPTYALCSPSDFAARSRWYRPLPVDSSASCTPANLPALLQSLPMEAGVLIPCSDDWLQAVVNLPDSLATRFRFSLPGAQVVQMMVNKWKFAELAERAGVPHPRTVLVQSANELGGMAEQHFESAIFKPLSSIEFASRHGVKGYLVHNRTQALAIAPKLEYPIMLQEYIPGPPTESYFIDGFVNRAGRITACFARRRLRMYPHDLGNSSLTASVSLSDLGQAPAILERLFATVPYRGIFSAEFKHDHRDGLFKILEINARPWWYVEFACRCGVNVCDMAYRDALEMHVEPACTYQVGRTCLFLDHDICACRDARKKGGLSLYSWVRSWARSDGALFAWDDPGPALAHGRNLITSHCSGARNGAHRRMHKQPPFSEAAPSAYSVKNI